MFSFFHWKGDVSFLQTLTKEVISANRGGNTEESQAETIMHKLSEVICY